MKRVAVIGGGLSGLAAAHRLIELSETRHQPLDLTLFEAGPRLGGLVETHRISDYLVECGADSFITNKPAAVELCRRLGLEGQLIPTDDRYRGALILHHGKPVPVPEGFALLSPSQLWPVLTSPLLSLRGKLRLACEYFIPPRTNGRDESLAEFVTRRFGKETLDRIVQPLVGGIYTSDPHKLSLAATMPRFLEMERRHGSLIRASRRRTTSEESERRATGARYALFLTVRDGLSTLIDRLQERIAARARLRWNTRVETLLPSEQGGYRIEHGNETETFDAVILALPAFRAADLIENWDATLAGSLRQIEYASSAIVVTGHRLTDIQHPLDSFGLVVPAIERRRILAVSFASRKFPGRAPEGHILLRTFVGGAMQPEELQRTDERMIEVVREELRDIFGVSSREDFALVNRYDRAMPQYHVGHLDLVERIEQDASRHPRFQLAGNAYHGVGIPDAIQSGESAAERVFSIESSSHSR